MKKTFISCIKLTAACLVFFSGLYTLIIFGIAQAAPNGGKGEILQDILCKCWPVLYSGRLF